MNCFSNDFDLDTELAKDESGASLKEIKNVLQEGLTELRRRMDRGLPAAEFKQAEALRKAFEAAATVLEGVWDGFHRR
jgi:type III secretion system YseE family protein